MIKRAFILALAFAATVSTAQDTNFAVRISCDFQQQAGAAELPDLTLLQGSAPMIQAAPMRMGRAVSADSLTTCQLVFGPSATSTYYVATNAYLATNSAYYIQLSTIGTNSVPAGSNSPAAWWYSILYYRNGGIYWSGSGRLYIERTTATGANGLVWQEWEAGAAKDDIARGWIADLSNVVDSIEVAGVDYGTNSTTAYRGDWGASVSNLAAQAAGWGDHALAGYLTAETDPVFSASDAYGITAAMLGNWDSAYGWGDHSTEGYLTSETDPVFAASDAAAVTAVKIGNWDTAYGWGDHAAAGYLTAETDPDFAAWLLTDPLAGYLTAETDAVALSAVAAVSGRVDVVESWGDHGEAGYLTAESDPAWSAWEPEAHVPIVCSGGYYFPDYFTLDPKPTAVSFTSYGSTQEYNSVNFQWRTFSAESGFALEPDISRQEDWDEEVAYSGLVNLEITPNGESSVASWLPGATTGTVGSFVASLGDFSRLVEVTYTASESAPSSNAYWLADLPGSLRENINSNTLAAASAPGVESNLYNADAYSTTSFFRNAACWAADFDLTCASPWNSYSGRYRAGTLVTSQHVAYAVHYTAPTGTVFRFVDATNGVHDRTLVDQRLLAYDIAIGLLDEPLGAEITPAKVLGMDQIGYLRGRYGLRDAPGLRLVYLDKYESAWLAGSSLMETVSGHRWESPYAYFSGSTNLPFSRYGAVGGDSGNPVFLLAGSNTVLVSTFYTPTSGPLLTYSRAAIEAAIADMGGSVHTNLPAPDLSAWENFDAGQDLPDF